MPSSATSRFAFPSVASPSLISKNILKSCHKHNYDSKVTQEVQIPTVQIVLGRRGHTTWPLEWTQVAVLLRKRQVFVLQGKCTALETGIPPVRPAAHTMRSQEGYGLIGTDLPAAQRGPAGKSLPCLNDLVQHVERNWPRWD